MVCMYRPNNTGYVSVSLPRDFGGGNNQENEKESNRQNMKQEFTQAVLNDAMDIRLVIDFFWWLLLCIKFLMLGFQLFNTICYRQISRHCSSYVPNCFSNFCSNLLMDSIGVSFTFDTLFAEHIFGLSGTEKICRKFCASHVVKYILRLFKSLALMDVFPVKTTIKPFIPFILKYGIVKRSLYASIIGGSGKLGIMFTHLISQEKPFLFLLCKRRIRIKQKFRSTGLYRKVCLCLSYNWFGRTCILHRKITGITAHEHCNYLSFSIRAYLNHFGLYHEMVIRIYPTVCARSICTASNLFKSPIISIFKDFGKLSGRPIFPTLFVYFLNTLKCLLSFFSESCTHSSKQSSQAINCDMWCLAVSGR